MNYKLHTLWYRIVYRFFWLLSLPPLEFLYVWSDLAYPLVRRFYRRKVVRRQLEECFPELSKEERTRIERKFYHHLCDLVPEILKQFSMSREEMMRRVKFVGLEPIDKGFDEGKTDLFCYLGHYGNWEWLASLQYWSKVYHCAQIYHPLYNKMMDRLFLDVRNRYGGECIPMKVVARTLVKRKAEGKKVFCGFISDQLPKWENIHHFTPFLNHDTAVFTGGEQMGKHFDAMMYYGRVTQPKRGYYVMEAVPLAHDSKDVADYEITDRYMALLEADIKAHPELWLWTHKRWRRTKEEWERRNSCKPE